MGGGLLSLSLSLSLSPDVVVQLLPFLVCVMGSSSSSSNNTYSEMGVGPALFQNQIDTTVLNEIRYLHTPTTDR